MITKGSQPTIIGTMLVFNKVRQILKARESYLQINRLIMDTLQIHASELSNLQNGKRKLQKAKSFFLLEHLTGIDMGELYLLACSTDSSLLTTGQRIGGKRS